MLLNVATDLMKFSVIKVSLVFIYYPCYSFYILYYLLIINSSISSVYSQFPIGFDFHFITFLLYSCCTILTQNINMNFTPYTAL